MIGDIGKLFSLLGAFLMRRIGLQALVSLIASVLESAGMGAVFWLFKVADDEGSFAQIPFADMLSHGAPSSQQIFSSLALALVAIVILRGFFQLLQGWLSLSLRNRTQLRLSSELFAGYVGRPYSFHTRTYGGEIFTHIWSNVAQIAQHFVVGLSDLISNTLLFLAIVGSLFWFQPKLTLAITIVLAALAGIIWLTLARPLRQWGTDWAELSKAVMQAVQEPFTGIKTVKLSGREPFFRSRFIEIGKAYTDAAQKFQFANQVARPVLETLVVSGMILAAVWAIGIGWKKSEVLASVALFGVGAYRLLPAATRIMSILQGMQFTRASLEQVCGDLAEIRSRKSADIVALVERPLQLNRKIRLENITYQYEGADAGAIRDVTFEIERGQAIAFVGESGAGKTTLADVLLGLLHPSAGRILVDGVEARTESLSYKRLFSYVPQEAFVSDATVRRNIALGRPDADIDDERVLSALKAAELADVILNLPEGLDTRLGERGLRLSGGERQRLGLARALYDQPQILVLDEATSSLDASTEDRISRTIQRLRGDITIVFIAHRLSTVQHCDRLFFLDAGRIVAAGRFSDLIADNAKFRTAVEKMKFAAA